MLLRLRLRGGCTMSHSTEEFDGILDVAHCCFWGLSLLLMLRWLMVILWL
jgi:hypothetical protein